MPDILVESTHCSWLLDDIGVPIGIQTPQGVKQYLTKSPAKNTVLDPTNVAFSGGTISNATITPNRITTPDQVGTLGLWFDAAQPMYTAGYGAVVANAGDQIGIWPDASGNGRLATASATKPTFNPTGLNGKPTVNFNGNSTFSTASFLDATFNAGFTLMMVHSTVAATAIKVILGTTANGLYVGQNDSSKSFSPQFLNLSPQPAVQSYVNTSGISLLSYNGSNTITEYDQLFNVASGAAGNCSGSNPIFTTTGTLGLTGSVTIGDLVAGGFTWTGSISEIILWKGALTQEQSRQMYDYLSAKWGFSSRVVVCAGNSLTSGSNSTGGPTQVISTTGTNYPCKLWASLGNNYTVRTDAYPGRTLGQMLVETPLFGDQFYLPAAAAKNIFVVWEITNALAQQQSRAAAYNQLVAYCKARRVQGFKVAILTCLPRQDTPYAGFEVDRLAINALIKSNFSGFADAIVDVASDARLQNPLNTTYFAADKVHLTDAGYAIVAGIVSPIVAAF